MAKGLTTRLQKDMEKMGTMMDGMADQLKREIHAEIMDSILATLAQNFQQLLREQGSKITNVNPK